MHPAHHLAHHAIYFGLKGGCALRQPTTGGSLFSIGILEKNHDMENPRADRQF